MNTGTQRSICRCPPGVVSRRVAAFTLVELLVVIAIIGILAGLIVGLAGRAGDAKKRSRIKAELGQLETAIESYKEKLGFYPPDNPYGPMTNQLFYELQGTVLTPAGEFVTLKGDEKVRQGKVSSFFGVGGFANSSTDRSTVQNFLRGGLRPEQYREISRSPDDIEVLIVPADGPNPIRDINGKPINPWRYASGTNAVNNPGGYDLWAEIKVGRKTDIIGNWRK